MEGQLFLSWGREGKKKRCMHVIRSVIFFPPILGRKIFLDQSEGGGGQFIHASQGATLSAPTIINEVS